MFDFNKIYWFYDFLARMVYGNTLEKAKHSLIFTIQPNTRVLIVGGGTGATLEYLNTHCTGIHVDYVEPSSGMLKKATKRSINDLEISFYNLPIEQFSGLGNDAVITEFFFDMFEEPQLENNLRHIKKMLHKDGIWLDTDFRKTSNRFHKLLTKMMIVFFRATVGMKMKHLLETLPVFSRNGLKLKEEVSFKNGFVTSRLLYFA